VGLWADGDVVCVCVSPVNLPEGRAHEWGVQVLARASPCQAERDMYVTAHECRGCPAYRSVMQSQKPVPCEAYAPKSVQPWLTSDRCGLLLLWWPLLARR
jgi:hypothetical protein